MKNLNNTKWIFKENLALDTIAGYNINFTSNGTSYVRLSIEAAMNPSKEMKFYTDGDLVDYPYHSTNGWNDHFQNDKSITIKSGLDNANPELISFLQENAKQVILTKNIVLNKDNIDLFPRTKASLLVEDDGETPFIPSVSLATENTLGGIIASPRTTETVEVKIDTLTGKLYVPEAILTAPNGTKYKLKVDNSGQLTTEIIQ